MVKPLKTANGTKTSADKYGAVYTPNQLADFIADLSLEFLEVDSLSEPLNVLDPSCGELSLLKAFHSRFFGSTGPKLIGVDVDPEAISVASGDDLRQSGAVELFLDDFLVPGGNLNSREFWHDRIGEVNLILANPPWSSERIYKEHQLIEAGFSLGRGQYDSYTLFIELSLKLLAPQGLAVFILPDSLHSGVNENLRRLLAENYSIKVIARLGEKLFPGVNRATTVIAIEKQEPSPNHLVDCFRLSTVQRKAVLNNESKLSDLFRAGRHRVAQRRFQIDPGFAFDVDVTEEEESLLQKIRVAGGAWADQIVFGRGVEISKAGFYCRCSHCGLNQSVSAREAVGNLKKCKHCGREFPITEVGKAISVSPEEGSTRVFVGEDIRRYKLSPRRFLEKNLQGISYKSLDLYEAPKLLVRKTGLGIQASMDESGSFVTQTVYILRALEKGGRSDDLWFYLGLLNSRLMLFYYLKQFGENEWKSHPYLTKKILLSLPLVDVRAVDRAGVERISRLVREVQYKYSREKDLELEGAVFKLYGIDRAERRMIEDSLNSLPDLQAFNEMKV